MTIGEKIRNAREDLDLSQTQVAELILMSQSNYSKLERDLQEPNLDQLRKICIALKLDPRYLLDLPEFDPIQGRDRVLLEDIKMIIRKYRRK